MADPCDCPGANRGAEAEEGEDALRDYPLDPEFDLSRRYSPFARAGDERTLCGRDAYPDQSVVYPGAKGAWRLGDCPEPWEKLLVG